MKKVKILFSLAGVFLLIFVCFLVAFIFLPENKKVSRSSAAEQTATDVESGKEIAKITETADAEESVTDALETEAEAEILRFRQSYGVDISYDEMIRQLKVRKEYEGMYGTSYELESVFLITTDDMEGDKGACIAGDAEDMEMHEENVIAEKIRRYVLLYEVDETRYEGMTNREKFSALEVEYGSLPDEGEMYEQTLQRNEGQGAESMEVEEEASADADAEDGTEE